AEFKLDVSAVGHQVQSDLLGACPGLRLGCGEDEAGLRTVVSDLPVRVVRWRVGGWHGIDRGVAACSAVHPSIVWPCPISSGVPGSKFS
ncbi:hypothetical protein, partial [Micromonospora aurantiaca]|uniref:hypothetical protein n=1 Tax=Micromonospora aurantiaca (nom. illeg.) TaxID=47850 RepID=UPI00197B74D1